jgi:hypothetical protein
MVGPSKRGSGKVPIDGTARFTQMTICLLFRSQPLVCDNPTRKNRAQIRDDIPADLDNGADGRLRRIQHLLTVNENPLQLLELDLHCM